MATPMEQASYRFRQIPSMLIENFPYVLATGIVNWTTDMVVGPPNEFSGEFWDSDMLSSNIKDSIILSLQDTVKFATSRYVSPQGAVSIQPVGNGADASQAYHSYYY